MRGIDVSKWQGSINWNRVKRAGVRFAMIKATEGIGYTDPCYDDNITGASAAGIACGCYHYLRGVTKQDVIAEADSFCDALDRHKSAVTLWASLDIEEKAHQDLGAKKLTDLVVLFCERVRFRGYKPMLYSNNYFITCCYDYERIRHYPLWFACWYDGGEADRPQRDFDYVIWQQGVTRVDGIAGDVDNDYGYFDLPGEGGVVEPGDLVQIKPGSFYYGTDIAVPDMVLDNVWVVEDVSGDRVLIDRSEDGTMTINSAVALSDVVLITPPSNYEAETGDIVHIKDGARYYGTDIDVPSYVLEKDWIVESRDGDRVVINYSTDGTAEINSAVYAKDLVILGKVEEGQDGGETEQPENPPEAPETPAVPETPAEPEKPEDPSEGENSNAGDVSDPEGKTDGGEENGEQGQAGEASGTDPQDPGEKEDAKEEEEMEDGLVSFFKMVLRALLIAVRSVFGKKKE